MNLELLIAKRIFSDKDKKSVSRPIVSVAIAGISIGIAVMIMAVAIVTGFKEGISNKVCGFSSHIQLTHYNSNNIYSSVPISFKDSIRGGIEELDNIRHTQVFAYKPGIIKSNDEIQGIILQGTSSDYDPSFIKSYLTEGEFYDTHTVNTSNKTVISSNVAKMLRLKTGDKFTVWFAQQPVRARRFEVSGIYNTGLQEFDNLFVFCDIRHIQKLNGWEDNQYSGIEIFLDDISRIDETVPYVKSATSYYIKDESNILKTRDIRDNFPHIFDWLDMINTNVWVILTLMTLVAGFNMVSGLLIIILEKTSAIGILKTLGHSNVSIRKIFVYLSAGLVAKGLLWGNIAGVGLCLIQYYFKVVKLDPVSYYIDTVPVNIDILHLVMLNIGCMAACLIMLIITTLIISKINPAKAVKIN